MTHTELELCARFLGDAYTWSGGGIWVLAENDEKPPMSAADLLLALLERAAELELKPCLDVIQEEWRATLDYPLARPSRSPTPLAAMMKAVEKYEEGKV